MERSHCLRCDGKVSFIGVEKIQLGQTGLIMGAWSNILAGSMEVEVHVCSKCGKIEFYANNFGGSSDNTPQMTCPVCGKTHDFDSPRCPFCKYKYTD